MMKVDTNAIQKQLKKYVFGQDELIKSLAVIAWTHEKNKERKNQGLEAINNRTLLIGPSGCGKTFAVKKLAKILNTRFIEIDCSTLQGNNYTGVNHAYDMFDSAITMYGKSAVENGIIFLDEFDKSLDVYSFKKYGARHVQRDLLKIFEGETVTSRNYGSINTKYMTIICAGSFFEGADASVYYNAPKVSKMGFGQDKIVKQDDGHTKFDFTIEDLISMGHLPELMGRFTRIVNMNLLEEKDIFNILKNGESQIKIYKQQLANMNIDLQYSDNYFSYLAKNVLISKTGFRDVTKLISEDIDDIIIRLNNVSVAKIVVGFKDDTVYISFFDRLGHMLERVNKPVIKKQNKIKINQSLNPVFDMD